MFSLPQAYRLLHLFLFHANSSLPSPHLTVQPSSTPEPDVPWGFTKTSWNGIMCSNRNCVSRFNRARGIRPVTQVSCHHWNLACQKSCIHLPSTGVCNSPPPTGTGLTALGSLSKALEGDGQNYLEEVLGFWKVKANAFYIYPRQKVGAGMMWFATRHRGREMITYLLTFSIQPAGHLCRRKLVCLSIRRDEFPGFRGIPNLHLTYKFHAHN